MSSQGSKKQMANKADRKYTLHETRRVSAYAYDHIGNAVLAASGGVTNAYAAHALNQYASILRASVSPCEILPRYDTDGNLTDDGLFSYVDFVRRQSPCVCDS